ncbi:cAMP phosphodiesterases class-II-domain-containing protein [Amylocarpus encephaloides]|uniref:cAMP phosphodiesterases class-II-domain-containing protein n=1 Tax=Amylocarpus encephaloides TaxID=45428 RepID=A0A9P8CBI4_9HELO|nr:cAMP phosphodiesterases class-II-domain-containing protein [Amylocarpus encephaloides]
MGDIQTGEAHEATMEVIILGSGGGPMEDNTTAFLVRSTSTAWRPNSLLAVDAGVHLASIVKILEQHYPPSSDVGEPNTCRTVTTGPFKGLELPNESVDSNALHITQNMVETFLMTHPHLDHISGFVVNTSIFDGSRRKILAGMPTTIEAFKRHIFNGIIWPNLSDENEGFGLIHYYRLEPGGNLMVKNGGYVQLCDGLGVKGMYVTHGDCKETHFRQKSHDHSGSAMPYGVASPGATRQNSHCSESLSEITRKSHFIPPVDGKCVTDSTAYFIRDIASSQEIIIFGDLEADSVSKQDRNRKVWAEAAPKFATSQLKGILIECSYVSSRNKTQLYGHLTPFYLYEELLVLAKMVQELKASSRRDSNKRKLSNVIDHLFEESPRQTPRASIRKLSPISPKSIPRPDVPIFRSVMANLEDSLSKEVGNSPDGSSQSLRDNLDHALHGLKVVIIHVKETMKDGRDVKEMIMEDLMALEQEYRLGCEFIMSAPGLAVYL